MVKNEARLSLIVELSSISHNVANKFEEKFLHSEKERSTNKQEIREIMNYFSYEMNNNGRPDLASMADELSEFDSIDDWILALRETQFIYDITNVWYPPYDIERQ